ncbi:hypothetical protein Trydic_g5882 [Trypoxylus dichotomus]
MTSSTALSSAPPEIRRANDKHMQYHASPALLPIPIEASGRGDDTQARTGRKITDPSVFSRSRHHPPSAAHRRADKRRLQPTGIHRSGILRHRQQPSIKSGTRDYSRRCIGISNAMVITIHSYLRKRTFKIKLEGQRSAVGSGNWHPDEAASGGADSGGADSGSSLFGFVIDLD